MNNQFIFVNESIYQYHFLIIHVLFIKISLMKKQIFLYSFVEPMSIYNLYSPEQIYLLLFVNYVICNKWAINERFYSFNYH